MCVCVYKYRPTTTNMLNAVIDKFVDVAAAAAMLDWFSILNGLRYKDTEILFSPTLEWQANL